MIAFQHVRFRYDERGAEVIADLSIEIPRGAFLGVIGPNGAGKTTFLKLLLGVLSPSSGRVLVDGREVRAIPPRQLARLIAAVPQEEALEFPFSVEEVVLLGRVARLGPLGFERASDVTAAVSAMEKTGVAQLANRPYHALSGGERKRVVLARALAQEAPILVLDEPAAALDIHHQIAIFDLLAGECKKGSTVVVVVHDLNLAAAYCDRLLLVRPPPAGTGPTPPAIAGTVEEILTWARVREVFGVDAYVGVNEITGHRFLIPMSITARAPAAGESRPDNGRENSTDK